MVFDLNGLKFDFNDLTGELKSMTPSRGDKFISEGGGLFDIAVPVKYDYEILRMAPNNKNAGRVNFHITGGEAVIEYFSLGNNIVNDEIDSLPEISGGIYAALTLKALDDGRSVSMKLHLTNNCEIAVKQIIFPDMAGLNFITNEQETRFTTLGFTSYPFVELADSEQKRNSFFAVNPICCGKIYRSGGYFGYENMIGRYYDFGSLEYGYSLFHKYWGFGPDNMETMADEVLVKLDQQTKKLRIGNIHHVSIPKGGAYESSEYILTPHTGGWINGIYQYKAWVGQNKKRVAPVPKSIREGLGYRTIWMKEQYPKDRESIVYYYDDLPKVARDMAEHGIFELSVWGEGDFNLPYGKHSFIEELGGFDGWIKNINILKSMGINAAPFVSMVSIWRDSCERYGLQIAGSAAGWAQNLKGIPAFQSPYMEKYCCAAIDQRDQKWQRDVMDSLRFLRDEAKTPSIGWDQYIAGNLKGGVRDIIENYRRETAELYPDATFSSESTFNFESEINALDYTWDWAYWPGTGDCRPYIHAIETTRPNITIDNSVFAVKNCFMDNIFMNIFTSKPGGVNGSAYIYEYPELSKTLKRAA
ncbi:MAG: hypothetical protein FWD23_16550, partial [Oscillospiraceae bacterium]|nr:hypothetical protein [Oscillospiraceae bacterium]